jgi:CrcB protein
MRLLVAVAVGGAVGTLLRALLAEAIPHDPGRWPWATLAANVLGALVLGVVARRVTTIARRGLLGAGFCGGLTTFSTLQLELFDLLDAGEPALATTYAAVSVAAGLAAVRLGERLGGPA